MARVVLVTYLFALSISSTIGNVNDCAIGPQYWCKSFENAQDCGAIQHCTDTVWSTDEKYTKVESSAVCQICQKIFTKTHEGLGDNEDLVKPNLLKACNLLPSDKYQSKCTKIVNDYGSSISSLMKKQRFATICHLIDSCARENTAPIVGQNRCTWGPSYWCSSLRNSRDCQATAHCINQIWPQQIIQMKNNDNVCQYCKRTIDKLKSIVTDPKAQTDVKKWLDGTCNMLQNENAIEQCKQLANGYTDEIVDLLKYSIDSGVICHLGTMCKDATLVSRNTQITEQSKMLCNAIVRATHDLHTNEKKLIGDIQEYLKNDCQQLTTDELKQKCIDIVEHYGDRIYGEVIDNTELSTICDKTVFETISDARCDLCQFAISSAQIMLKDELSEDKVLEHIDNQLCLKLDGKQKVNCQSMLNTYREILLTELRQDKQSILICTYFQLCFHQVSVADELDIMKTNPFFYKNFCDHLGPFEQTCHALINRNSTALIKGLIDNINGNDLCEIFGMCPKQMSFLDDLSIRDDTNKCKRCIDDFTRRKHIAEKLLNYSILYLEHLCGQIPQKDQCLQSVNESIEKLRTFIQSLNPNDICQELKLCDQTMIESIETTPLYNAFSDQLIDYTSKEICTRSGPLSTLCNHIVRYDRIHLLTWIPKSLDPHQVCSIIDICPKTNAFENCNNQCECCISKVENYQTELSAFLNGMVTAAQNLCDHMPYSTECQQIADGFKKDVDDVVLSINPKQICQMFTHCSESSISSSSDKCQICQTDFIHRQENFREILLDLSSTIQTSCSDDSCRFRIQSNYQTFINQLNSIDSLSICHNLGSCLNLGDFDSTIEDISEKICEKFDSLKSICEQLLTSKDNLQLYKTYKAFFNSNFETINADLQEGNSTSCDQCKQAVQLKKDRWLNSLETIRNTLLQACEKCPSKDQCRIYVNQRFDNLTFYVKQIDPQQICQNLHFCSSLISIDSCSTCIERFNLRQQAFLQGIDRLAGYFTDYCQKLSNKECQIYVKELKDSIQQTIYSVDTKDTCTSIGFCDQSNSLDFNEYEKTIENEINEQICSTVGPFQTLCQHILHGNIDEIQHLQIDAKFEDLEQFETGNKCKCCIARVQRRKFRIKFTGDLLFRILIRSCGRRLRCRRAYRLAKARFDARIHRICPYRVCQRFGYCNKTTSIEIQSPTIDRTNSTCILCNYVMNYLSNYIHLNSTEEEIEDSLEQICDQLPTILQNQCREYIDDYSPAIISILLNDFNLTSVCQKLNLCPNQITIDINHLIKADTNTCGICDYLSTYIYFERKRHSNTNYLTTVCSKLSNEYQAKCQTILQLFAPFINELDLNPANNFCKQLSICQIPMIDLKDAQIINEQANALPKCSICEYIISYLDAALRNNKSQQAIEEALAKVCTILPGTEREQCNQLIKTYGPVIAQLIADSADPDMICRRIGLCQQTTTAKINYNKCLFGREYWCTNRQTAELCNAVDFCEREVWNKFEPVIY